MLSPWSLFFFGYGIFSPLFFIWIGCVKGNDVVAVEEITFVSTKNMDLKPLPLDYTATPTVNDIEELVGKTEVFRGKFFSKEPTDMVPVVEMIRGSEIADDDNDKVTRASSYGFVGTVAEAYSKHHNLSIRPDDIWQAILAQFSYYVQGRAEELRDTFVDFEGQQDITLIFASTMRTLDWSIVPDLFLKEIDKYMKTPDIRDWFLPNFTTTTEVDKVGAAASAMCTFQAYFTYTAAFICGIPQITLKGGVDDWKNLRQRIERLEEFDDGTGILTEEWLPLLRDILDEFVVSSETGSNSNLEFWHQIMHTLTIPYSGKYLTGWITAFTFFNRDGNKAILSEESAQSMLSMMAGPLQNELDLPWGMILFDAIHADILTCPIKIIDLDGQEYNSTLFVGQMAFDHSSDDKNSLNNPVVDPSFVEDILQINPRTDWSVVVESNNGLVPAEPPQRDFPSFPDICRGFEPDKLLDESEVPEPIRKPIEEDESPFPGCFSENSIVVEKSKGPMSIKNLQIGDMIQSSSSGAYSRVYSFGHRNENMISDFLQIRYATNSENKNGKKEDGSIETTSDHLLSVNGSMIPASLVKTGDSLLLRTETSDKKVEVVDVIVSKIQIVRRRGVYAPFTESGTILINDILASTYVTLQPNKSHLIINAFWKDSSIADNNLSEWNTQISHHSLAQMFQTFHRISCRINWSWCANERYTEEGISTWVYRNMIMFSTFLMSISNDRFSTIMMIVGTLTFIILVLSTLASIYYKTKFNKSNLCC